MIKDINQEMLSHYDIFAQIAKTDLGFPITIPVVDAGAILYRIPAMAEPVYQQMESIIHSLNKWFPFQTNYLRFTVNTNKTKIKILLS